MYVWLHWYMPYTVAALQPSLAGLQANLFIGTPSDNKQPRGSFCKTLILGYLTTFLQVQLDKQVILPTEMEIELYTHFA